MSGCVNARIALDRWGAAGTAPQTPPQHGKAQVMPNDSIIKSPVNATCFGPTHFMFARPVFTARKVAKVLGIKLDRKLSSTDGDEDIDGCIDVTSRVHVQVGADYLVVSAWIDATTLKQWPPRRNIPWAYRDVQDALRQYPGERP